MFENSPYGSVAAAMLEEANHIISDTLPEQPQSEPVRGIRRALMNLLQRRPAFRPQPAGFHREPSPSVESGL